MDFIRRIPNCSNWPNEFVNEIVQDDALQFIKKLPDECIALVVTSPPYWNIVDYGIEGQIGQTSYEDYLQQLLPIWSETKRILIPNGKLAIITPIMPIPKSVMGNQHTRHLKNISADIEQTILHDIAGLERYSLFLWQKQTTEKMFGSYPYPPNIYEDNTIEFINVFVKSGVPSVVSREIKEHSKITQEEWRNLTMQLWAMYPEDVKRAGGHPCPFPVVLPQRLIKMYTFRGVSELEFEGDIVLDMFNGTGATCVAARSTGRNWIGVDLHPGYCETAKYRVRSEIVDSDAIILQPVKVKSAKNSRQLQLFSENNNNDYNNQESKAVSFETREQS